MRQLRSRGLSSSSAASDVYKRQRKYRTPKSILLVVAQKGGLDKGARNLPGVDVVTAKDLSAEDLAPGGDIGRLTVWTKSAVEALE